MVLDAEYGSPAPDDSVVRDVFCEIGSDVSKRSTVSRRAERLSGSQAGGQLLEKFADDHCLEAGELHGSYRRAGVETAGAAVGCQVAAQVVGFGLEFDRPGRRSGEIETAAEMSGRVRNRAGVARIGRGMLPVQDEMQADERFTQSRRVLVSRGEGIQEANGTGAQSFVSILEVYGRHW
ncbi:hypothetical protein ACFXPR_07550 [Nocardia tengchongensis]|uniref:hypothetical protein n=1 Tax=Nocardia tengchongensis TaxID=2055889 RepID=UPI0036BCCDF4